MTDRELLELAAKAAGDIEDWEIELAWNPLYDDGDALQLAVKLKLDIDHVDSGVHVWWAHADLYVREEYVDDPYTATRRAIVRAAAEIGKGKE